MKYFCRILPFIFLVAAVMLAQQQQTTPSVSTIFAVFTKDVDCKSAKTADPVTLKVVRELIVGGKIIIPKGATINGRLVEPPSDHALAIVLEEAVLKDGSKVPIQGIISAMAAPAESLGNDPTYTMMHSQEPKPSDAGSNMATTGAAAATAVLKGGKDPSWRLTEDSQGSPDLGLTIRWELAKPPAVTIVESKKKPFRLKSGTQAAIRMATPKA